MGRAVYKNYSLSLLIYLSSLLFFIFNVLSKSECEAFSQSSKKDSPRVKPAKSDAELAEEINRRLANTETQSDGTMIVTDYQEHSKAKHTHDRSLGDGDLGFASGDPEVHRSSTVKNGIKFTLYNLANRSGQPITFTTTANSSTWNSSERAVFIIHGYTVVSDVSDSLATKNMKAAENIRDAFFEMNRTENIIITDWHAASKEANYFAAAKEANYFAAAKDSQLIGEVVGDMIISLQLRKFLQYSQVYLVGFSLGGQIAGIAGYRVRKKTDQLISRITALDPSGAGFDTSIHINKRIDKTDAEFVDIIHCDAGDLWPNRHLGTTEICGHVDFFPNGGNSQPGCDKNGTVWCSHMKCPQLYASTVRGAVFNGCPCENKEKFANGMCGTCSGPPMGLNCPVNAKGVYYLKAKPLDIDNVD